MLTWACSDVDRAPERTKVSTVLLCIAEEWEGRIVVLSLEIERTPCFSLMNSRESQVIF